MGQELFEKLQSMLGQESGPYQANDVVNPAMTRHWCEAMQDGNPLYTDEAYAKNSKFGGVIAPPQMAQTYCLPALWPPDDQEPNILGQLSKMMDDAGYAGVVATTTSHEYFAPMRPGDHISYGLKFMTASEEKKTSLGTGFFLTVEYSYTNQNGELVCKQPFTIFKFKI